MTRPKAWPKPDAPITIIMTQAQAEAGGLVACECGHPINQG